MPTYHIHIEGQVQGVGFRPFVYRLAHQHRLTGQVSNGTSGVHIFFTCPETTANDFYQNVITKKPERAIITRHLLSIISPANFSDFSIENSTREQHHAQLLLTPDLGLCDDCRREIHDPGNRRAAYPFITCINCGPRYSILQQLPYDRENTTMAAFRMCPGCLHEYDNPHDRRHYSQTNSCPHCAISLYLKKGKTAPAISLQIPQTNDTNTCIEIATQALAEGLIVAVKGIGGYLLVCDAANPKAIARLRQRKFRPTKPFALIYPNRKLLEKDVYLHEVEAQAFLSIESPIVLCRQRKNITSGILSPGIAPGLNHIGVMQPYTPLLELLLSKWQKPIIATSGNLSGSPIFYEDTKAIIHLEQIADLFLIHNREIIMPEDDSVIRFSAKHKQPIVIRRSRGYAPTFISQTLTNWPAEVLAMGADMKATFSIQHAGNTYISQYLGDLSNYETQQQFEHTLQHITQLLNARPQSILIDAHPEYISSAKGKTLAAQAGIPAFEVQHHIAHFSAVLAENELFDPKTPILGVIWDGNGYGNSHMHTWPESGNLPSSPGKAEIWGSEFFIFENNRFERVEHVDFFPNILGDKMAREPRLSALALTYQLPEAIPLLKLYFTEKEWSLYYRILAGGQSLNSSSMGRMFDAVAALLDLNSKNNYEGEAAMYLESLAMTCPSRYRNQPAYPTDRKMFFQQIIADLLGGKHKSSIAYRFHRTLVRWVNEVATARNVSHIAFSGGVFQNALLVDLLISELGEKFRLFFHKTLSPNDECISFGQLAYTFLTHKDPLCAWPFPEK